MISLNSVHNTAIKTSLESYLKQEWRPEALKEVESLVANFESNEKLLRRDFCHRLEFGTAGLRGPMKTAGTNVMNVLTVLQTSQGLANFLEDRKGSKDVHVVIGYDGRHNSKEFAEFASAAMLARGFKVSLFGSSKPETPCPTPTPYTPYYLIKSKADFGIQVTASHNPKDDNGYKVYDFNGAQIIPPVDAQIASYISKPENLVKWNSIDSFKKCNQPLIGGAKLFDPMVQVWEEYFNDTRDAILVTNPSKCDELKVVYTAMHGVGSDAVQKMAQVAQFNMSNFHVVACQDRPDPEFTTVVFPNPEEKGALDIAMQEAGKIAAQLVIANDPDADRFSFCERLPSGEWKQFTGDEIGVLLSTFVLNHVTEHRGIPAKDCLLACSAVSSGMMRAVCQSRGATVIDTLTGFKWIMNGGFQKAAQDNLKFIFGYEEAIGYCLNVACPDKDGVSAAGFFLQQAMRVYASGKTFVQVYEELCAEHGHFISNNSYVICHEKEVVAEMFREFRNDGKYLPKVGKYEIRRIRDVTTGFDNGEHGNKCALPITPEANMITLYFDFGRITIRTSGTEPKLKWYAEGSGADVAATEALLTDLVFSVIDDIFKPSKYPLEKVPSRD